MPPRSTAVLGRIVNALMLLAVVAFALQTAVVGAAQAAASAGFMPHAAVTLNGTVHYHGEFARQVHTHGGETTSGHVHDHAVPDHHAADESGSATCWSLGSVWAVMPLPATIAALNPAGGLQCRPHDRADGTEPDGLIRPPSTPGIA